MQPRKGSVAKFSGRGSNQGRARYPGWASFPGKVLAVVQERASFPPRGARLIGFDTTLPAVIASPLVSKVPISSFPMTNCSAARLLILASALSFASLSSKGAEGETGGNLITNGSFEAGLQFWKGDGKNVLLHDGNRVCEIEASKSRMREIHQEFHMKQLQQVEILFRAHSVDYKGPGIRVSVHQPGGGSVFWTEELPEDGSWRDIHIKYTRSTANVDLRDLVIATFIGSGTIQIDDVEVREPGKMLASEPSPPPEPARTPTPKPAEPLALVKPLPAPAPPVAAAPPPPAATPPAPTLVVPPGAFGSLEQILNSVPVEALRKLQDSATADAGAAEVNAYLAQNVKSKPAVFRFNVLVSEPVPAGQNKYRVQASDRFVASNGGVIKGRVWAYFPEATAPADGQANVGSEIIVTGVLGRCDVTTKGGLWLNIDLQRSKIGPP